MKNKKPRQVTADQEVIRDFAPRRVEPIQARNERQQQFIDAIFHNTLTIADGEAGTGKTFISAAIAVEYLQAKEVEKIIITRPVLEAGESLGFLPGEINDKFAPYFAPFREALEERLGKGHVEYLVKAGRIECAPLAYMRGRTFKNAFVVLDEAQNTTPKQMKLFLTRLGEGSKVIVNGDLMQKDLSGESGLEDALKRLRKLRRVRVVEFGPEDIVRSRIVSDIVAAYKD